MTKEGVQALLGDALNEMGYATLSLDQRGHGETKSIGDGLIFSFEEDYHFTYSQGKEPIHHFEGAPGDNGDRAVKSAAKPAQQIADARFHLDQLRARGKSRQRAVEIEEKGGTFAKRRQRLRHIFRDQAVISRQ